MKIHHPWVDELIGCQEQIFCMQFFANFPLYLKVHVKLQTKHFGLKCMEEVANFVHAS